MDTYAGRFAGLRATPFTSLFYLFIIFYALAIVLFLHLTNGLLFGKLFLLLFIEKVDHNRQPLFNNFFVWALTIGKLQLSDCDSHLLNLVFLVCLLTTSDEMLNVVLLKVLHIKYVWLVIHATCLSIQLTLRHLLRLP